MARSWKRYLLLVLGVAALGYFIYKSRNSITLAGFSWRDVGASLGAANPLLLAGGVGVIYLCYALRALRWMRFSHWIGPTTFGGVYSSTLMGFACVFLLGRAGEPIRPVLISRKDSLPIPGMFGVFILERIFDMGAAAVLAGVGLLLFRHATVESAESTHLLTLARTAGVGLLAGFGVAVCFLVYFRYHGSEWLAKRLKYEAWRQGWRHRVASLLEGFSEGLQGIRTWGDLGGVVGISVVHWFGVAVCYYMVLHAFGGKLAQLGFLSCIVVLAFTLVGSAVQLPAVGGGAQAATFLVLSLFFGIEKEAAAVAAIVMWIIAFASCSLAGIPLLLKEGWSMGDLKRMAAAEEKAAEAEEARAWEGRRAEGETGE